MKDDVEVEYITRVYYPRYLDIEYENWVMDASRPFVSCGDESIFNT